MSKNVCLCSHIKYFIGEKLIDKLPEYIKRLGRDCHFTNVNENEEITKDPKLIEENSKLSNLPVVSFIEF